MKRDATFISEKYSSLFRKVVKTILCNSGLFDFCSAVDRIRLKNSRNSLYYP